MIDELLQTLVTWLCVSLY